MGIVEQFSLEGLEVVMPARRYRLTAITTAPASRLRSATGAVAPFLTLSMYRQERSHCYVRFSQGEGVQNSCRTSLREGHYKHVRKPQDHALGSLWDRRGIACGVDACDGEAARASLSLVISLALNTALSVLKIAGEGIKRCVRLPRCMCSNGKLCKLHFRTRTQHVYSVCCGTATVCNYITGYGAVW